MLAKIFNSDKGAILVTGLMFLTVLSLIGTTAYITTSNDLKTSRNYRLSKKAFYDADAGIEFGLAKVEASLDTSSTWLPTTLGNTVSVSVADKPSAYNFTLSTIAYPSTDTWTLTSIGSDPNSGASSEIEVLFQRDPESVFGGPINVCGDGSFKSASGVYSYDSSTTPNPTPGDSTGEADVNVGGTFTDNGTTIDGDINLSPCASSDPLGINGGGTYDPTTYSSSNDNALAGVGTTILGDTTLCGKPGGANYYFTRIELGNNDDLIIDNDNSTAYCIAKGLGPPGGPINIFHNKPTTPQNNITFGAGSTLTVDDNFPSNLAIYSNTAGNITLTNDGDFYGLIYAPDSYIDTKNGSSYYGAFFGSSIDMKSGSELYFDTDILEATNLPTALTGDTVSITSWRNVLGI